jgi:predicted metal-dependent hydrolase
LLASEKASSCVMVSSVEPYAVGATRSTMLRVTRGGLFALVLTVMIKTITLNNQSVNYNLKTSPRSRNLRLTVCCDASVVVSKPQGFSDKLVERFLQSKAGWILIKLEYFKNHVVTPVKIDPKEYSRHKKAALHLARQLLSEYNQYYNFRINSIKIKNQKTRWGSCSRSGNLNFSYRLALLPDDLARYLIVHELCHLGELNHSAAFWRLVSQTVPDYLNKRKRLRLIGLGFLQ